MSRSQHELPDSPTNSNSNTTDSSSPIEFERRAGPQLATEPSSSSPQSPQQDSSLSEAGYPSWLPKRPPPPGPRSTIHSASVPGMYTGGEAEAGPSTSEPFIGGRNATPRSVRIVNPTATESFGEKDQEHPRRESTDPSRLLAGAQARVWSRGASAGMSSTLFSAQSVPRPRFRSTSLRLELLQSPSWRTRLWYYLFPIFVFFHLPLQTFFDFNAVFVLLL